MTSSHAVERLDVKGAEFCSACKKPIFTNGYGRHAWVSRAGKNPFRPETQRREEKRERKEREK